MNTAVVENITGKPDQKSSEIIELAEAAGYNVVVHYEVELDPPHARQYLPEMKLERFKFMLEDKKIDKIIISDALRPNQSYQLGEKLDYEIIDKPMLILEIFERKANSLDIKLQVQLAQLKYSVPKMSNRLSEAVHSERAGYGAGGEQVTDVMLSDVRSRIRTIEQKIDDIRSQISNQSKEEIPRLPIVGYYSAGKSTLFNMLTESSRDIGAEAFTTMILKTERSTISGYPLDLIDTVGLVDLPTNIISAFDLMLTEIFSFSGMILCLNASLSLEHWKSHFQDFLEYVDKFTQKRSPRVIIALTKTDLVERQHLQDLKEYLYGNAWFEEMRVIESRSDQSELTQSNFIDAFEDLFSDQLTQFYYQHQSPSIASKIHNIARVEEQEWHNDGTTSLAGIGPTNLLDELKGEIFQ